MTRDLPPDRSPVEARCYSGFRGDERPLSFSHGGGTYEVAELLDSWYESGPGRDREIRRIFKVRLESGETVVVDHNEGTGAWRFLRQIERGGS